MMGEISCRRVDHLHRGSLVDQPQLSQRRAKRRQGDRRAEPACGSYRYPLARSRCFLLLGVALIGFVPASVSVEAALRSDGPRSLAVHAKGGLLSTEVAGSGRFLMLSRPDFCEYVFYVLASSAEGSVLCLSLGATPPSSEPLSPALSLPDSPHVGDREAALRHGQHPRQVDPQILFRQLVVHGLGQQPHRPLDEFNSDPLARATVIVVMISSSLGNEVEGAPILPPEPFWPEYFGVFPYPGVVVGAVEV